MQASLRSVDSCSLSWCNILYAYTLGFEGGLQKVSCVLKMCWVWKNTPALSTEGDAFNLNCYHSASSSTLDQKGSTPESTPRPRSGVFQPVTRCISRQPCAPANGTKTKHFIRLIASVCTSRILMGIERPEENRTRLRQSVNGTEVLVSEGESGLWKHLMQTIWRGW